MQSKRSSRMAILLSSVILILLIRGSATFHASLISGFSSRTTPLQHWLWRCSKRTSYSVVLSSSYGRGAEIWPECNEEPVKLAGSFPNGEIPASAQEVLVEETVSEMEEESTQTEEESTQIEDVKKTRLPRKVYNLLKRAAGAQEEEAVSGDVAASLDLSPALIAIALLVGRLVVPIDVLLAVFMSGYTIILGQLARFTRRDGSSPAMPSLPPQGHVPALVSNPLGTGFTNSDSYSLWIKTGALVGLLGPLATILKYTVFAGAEKQVAAAKACARPLFLLCCQALSEAISRRVVAPLPVRILIPVAYNAIRLGPLWSWALTLTHLGLVGRLLAVANLIYWAANLFVFLLPIATIRYMRAHFYCVEAEQVTTRTGFEDSVGLLP